MQYKFFCHSISTQVYVLVNQKSQEFLSSYQSCRVEGFKSTKNRKFYALPTHNKLSSNNADFFNKIILFIYFANLNSDYVNAFESEIFFPIPQL